MAKLFSFGLPTFAACVKSNPSHIFPLMDSAFLLQSPPAPVPLGVTGHRSIRRKKGRAGPAPDVEAAEEGITIDTVMSGLRTSVPNNDPGAEMGCTTPGAVGAGAMGQGSTLTFIFRSACAPN